MKRLLTALALALLVGAARADALFDQPRTAQELVNTVLSDTARALRQARQLRGQFMLAKHLRDIPAPLTAQGDFVFVSDLGIYWHTRTPFDSVFVLTEHGAVQRDEGGEAFRLDADQQPGVRAALEIFVALFRLDVDALSNNFQLYGERAAQGWRVGLRPKAQAMNALFTQAVVSGTAQIERIELLDAHGDRTTITVQAVRVDSQAADATTRALFQ